MLQQKHQSLPPRFSVAINNYNFVNSQTLYRKDGDDDGDGGDDDAGDNHRNINWHAKLV